MPKSGTSEVPAPTNTSTPAATSSKRAAKGAATKKGTKNVDNATTKKGGKKADSATTKKRGEKVEPTIDASLKWQPTESIFDVVPEHDWDNFMAVTRKAWLETPDQDMDVGDYRSRVACKKLKFLAIFTWTDPRGVDRTVIREQISASGESHKTLDECFIARKFERAVDKGMASDPMRKQPPNHLVMFRMAQIMLKPHSRNKDMTDLAFYLKGKCGQKGKEKQRFKTPCDEALDGLWRKHDTWPTVEAEYNARSKEVKEAMKTIHELWNPRSAIKRSQYEQFDRDEIAAEDPSILIRVPDGVIHILTDCNGDVLTFCWPKALQWFFGDDLVEKTAEHIELYARHHKPEFPDQGRHAMNPYWCRKHPEYQPKGRKKEGKVPLGVYNFGCGGVTGHKTAKPTIKPDSKNDKKPEVIRLREEMMREGVMPWITKTHKFVQGILDPGLLAAQMKVMQHYDSELTRPTIEGDPFPLRAILVNPLTTDHRDKSDLSNGFALMTTTGSFKEGDLCCRQAALRMSFEAGTITAVRGAEMPHSTTNWEGETRYCIVHTCGEQLRAYAEIMDKEGENRLTQSSDEMDVSEKMGPHVDMQDSEQEVNESNEEATDREEGDQTDEEYGERYEDEDEEEEEAVGTAQRPIELLETPSESEEEWEEEAVGTEQNPIELSASPSPASRKRKRGS